jgi:hypothetical protein
MKVMILAAIGVFLIALAIFGLPLILKYWLRIMRKK